MKNIDYATEEHRPSYGYCDVGTPKYAIDWDRNEERFKTVGRGAIHVYQGGRVEIMRVPYRDPDLRRSLFKKYDIDFRLSKDTRGIKFFAPDGRPVVKKHIVDGILFIDHEHKMALYGYKIYYVERGYAPKSDKQVAVKLWQPEKEAEFLEKWGDTLKLGITMCALADTEKGRDGWKDMQQSLYWMRHQVPLSATDNKTTLESLGFLQTRAPVQFTTMIREICAKTELFDYLRVEEK